MDNAVVMEEEAANNDHPDAGRRRFAPPGDEATWHMPTDNERYRPYITSLMNFFHDPDPPYTKDTVFTRLQLLGINPTVIKRWLVNKAYGKEEYDQKRDVPQGARASSLEMMKKAVSYFMPNRAVAWVNEADNPTRHSSVHEVIADVKKAEARHQGRSSQATRPLREAKFRKSLEMLKRKSDWNSQYKYSIMSLWQFTIIARTDNIVHFEVTHPRGNPKFPFTLKLKVFWSKNINEERQCPDQILLGSMDDDICILINLSIYLELYLEQFPQAVLLFTEDLELANDAATERLKARYRSALTSTWNTAEFKSVIDESDYGLKIGTHSQRKLPATYASNKGLKYKLKEGVELPVEWLYENVIPNIRAKFPRDNRLCRVLALTLLYACMHEDILVPPGIKSRVRTAYGELNQDTQQPVEKVPLFVHRRDDQLMIDEAIIIDGDGSTGAGGGVVAGNSTYDLLQSIKINIQQLQQQLNNVAARSDTNFSDLRAYIQHRDRILNNNICAFGGTIEGGLQIQQANAGRRLLPLAARGANVDVGPVKAANMAILSGNPRSLYKLWREYQHGIAGRKPARYFTATEQNCSRQMKQKFYRRKQVWDTISRLVANGHTVQSAIERIKQVYGQNVSVTRIMDGIIRDKRQYGGPHPNLV
ncbi:unnamed protein product [Cylindrotheca closterium]|uniref:Transcription activator GCR1-like domain-containing protein n=1 Tax=Cylindrotheca closterium TaxID=2856 RepID=A0AAD2FFL2_9STRA|nr:unnamed protein product [Cylindrotheca closterium]